MAASHSSRTPTWVRVVVLACIAVLLLWTGWIVIRGLIARDHLMAAVPVASELRASVLAGESDTSDELVHELKDRAAAASEMTHDPVWRLSEFIPWVGPNLAAVRQVTEVAQTLADDGVDPLVSAASQFDPGAFAITGGTVELAPIVAVQDDISTANDAMASASRQADAIDVDATVGPVRDAVEQLLELVDEVTGTVDALDRTSHLIPAMLGADGTRNTLLLIQNNAELRASGGIAGALAVVTATDGAVELTEQATAGEFQPPYPASILPLDEATHALYGGITGRYVQDVNLTPWFDTSGQLAKAMWEDRKGGTVDAVVGVDPVMLSYLLDATGPVQVGDITLTSDNVIEVLLSESYARLAEPSQQDAFFAAAAQAVFSAVTDSDAEPEALVEALIRAGDEQRIRIWSSHDDEQQFLVGTTLSGLLPVDNSDGPRLGIYLNDGTGAKMNYYTDVEVQVGAGVCDPEGRPSYRATITLTNNAPADAATSLPSYVTGGGRWGTEPGRVETFIAVYGPVGAMNQGATLDGEAASGLAAIDRGRPAVVIPTELGPGESVTLDVDFLAKSRATGPLTVDLTPTLNLPETRFHSLSC